MAKLAAKVYGEALFGAAVDDGKADVLLKEIPMVQKALAENPELSAVMDHPKILKEEKMQILEAIFRGKISDEFCGLILLAAEKDRYQELPAILEDALDRIKEYKKIGKASVTSAAPLSDVWKEKIQKKLLSVTDYEILEISWNIDPSLLGGMVVQMGDRVVDGSLKRKLEGMTRELNQISLG